MMMAILVQLTDMALLVRLKSKQILQEFGDAVAQCVHYCPEQRSSAELLLKHKFFRLAPKHPQNLIKHLWRHIPEDPESPAGPVLDSDSGDLSQTPGFIDMSIHHASIVLCTLEPLETSLRQDLGTSEELSRRNTIST